MKTEVREHKMEIIEPVGRRVLIRKDDDKKRTNGGIYLPDDCETLVLTGRVVAISKQVENDPDFPIREYDKVIVNPSRSTCCNPIINSSLFLLKM